MPKIALVANTDWYLYNFRLSLARFLAEQGFDLVLISPPGEFAAKITEAGFRWIAWPVGRKSTAPWSELHAVQRLETIYRQEKPDLLHHHTIKPVLYGSLGARRLHIPCLVNSITGRGYVFLGQDRKARLILPAVRLFYRLALNHPNERTIFENDADRQYFIDQKLVQAENTRLVQGVGVDPQRFTPAPEPPGRPVVVLPARMLWDKGVGELVEAARILQRQIPDEQTQTPGQPVRPRIALVGEPDPGNPASIPAETLQGWQAEGIIEWWGWQKDMHTIYQQAHIVTLPTYGEGIPTVLLEAAASGKPIVASDYPGSRDVVIHGHNGLLVPVRDAPALAQALALLAGDTALRGRMGAAGRQLILEKFTTTRINLQTLDIYRQLLHPAAVRGSS